MNAAFGELNSEYLSKIIEETAKEEPQGESQRDARATLECPGLIDGGFPTSVHQLRPQNVEVIGAIGDSLTVRTV